MTPSNTASVSKTVNFPSLAWIDIISPFLDVVKDDNGLLWRYKRVAVRNLKLVLAKSGLTYGLIIIIIIIIINDNDNDNDNDDSSFIEPHCLW
jgi:hypothetical protein